MKKVIYLITLISLHLFTGCSPKSTQDTKEEVAPISKADEVVNRAIAWAGGMDKWNSLQKITYTKRSRLLLENEVIEYDITQKHEYLMNPSLVMDINWETDGNSNRVFHSDTASQKFLNDSLIDEGQKARESAFSALYVLGMPFKLKDAGIYLTYEGQKEYREKTADIIKATYSPEDHDNHSTSDVWWYYFDAADGAFLGCMVYHAPTYALIENIAFHDLGGMKFQKRRMSYRCDSLGNKQFLRAEFWYEDFELAFLDN